MLPCNEYTYPVELTNAKAILDYVSRHRHPNLGLGQSHGIFQNALRQLITQIKDEAGISERNFSATHRLFTFFFGPHESAHVGTHRILIARLVAGLDPTKSDQDQATIEASIRERHVWYLLDDNGQIVDSLIPERDFENHAEAEIDYCA